MSDLSPKIIVNQFTTENFYIFAGNEPSDVQLDSEIQDKNQPHLTLLILNVEC